MSGEINKVVIDGKKHEVKEDSNNNLSGTYFKERMYLIKIDFENVSVEMWVDKENKEKFESQGIYI